MGGAHIFSGYCQCLNCDAKKSSFLYKSNLIGNTIIRKMNSTKEFIQIFDKKYYISDSYLKDLISIDTELFTASEEIFHTFPSTHIPVVINIYGFLLHVLKLICNRRW